MEPLTLLEVLEATGARVMAGPRDAVFPGIATDTRGNVDSMLYIALRGARFDGNAFAIDALARGARGVLVETGRAPHALALQAMKLGGRTILECNDTEQAMLAIAARYRSQFNIPFVGIGGAAGKTTTKEIAAHLLSKLGSVVASEKSFNNSVGVPLTIFRVDNTTKNAVVEIGTNAPGEVGRLAAVVRPTIGIITIIAEEHLEGLHSLDGVAGEEGSLLDFIPPDGTAVLNADDRYFPLLRSRAKCNVVTFGIENKADFRAENVIFHVAGSSFVLDGRAATVPLIGTHNVYNALGATAIATRLGLPVDEAVRALGELKPPHRRLERKRFGEVEVIDDCYNANPGSVRAAVRALEGLRNGRRRIFILGKMHELGIESARLHREMGRTVGAARFDLFIAVGSEAGELTAGAVEGGMPVQKIIKFPTTSDLEWAVASLLSPGDLILIKGSRAEGLEKVVDAVGNAFRPRAGGQSLP